jgi:hypothetical protein
MKPADRASRSGISGCAPFDAVTSEDGSEAEIDEQVQASGIGGFGSSKEDQALRTCPEQGRQLVFSRCGQVDGDDDRKVEKVAGVRLEQLVDGLRERLWRA